MRVPLYLNHFCTFKVLFQLLFLFLVYYLKSSITFLLTQVSKDEFGYLDCLPMMLLGMCMCL